MNLRLNNSSKGYQQNQYLHKLICPNCYCQLNQKSSGLICRNCLRQYRLIENEVPIFIEPDANEYSNIIFGKAYNKDFLASAKIIKNIKAFVVSKKLLVIIVKPIYKFLLAIVHPKKMIKDIFSCGIWSVILIIMKQKSRVFPKT